MSNFTDLAPGLEQQLLAPVTQEPRQEPQPVVAPLAPGLAEQFGLQPDPAEAQVVDQERERRLQQSFREAFNTDPEFQAEALRHAGELGVTRAAAAAHPEIAKRMLAQRALEYQQLQRTYPTLLEKFSNVDFAAVAHDDIGNLKATETSWERLGRNFDVGQDTNKRGYLGVRQALGWLTPDEQVELDRINVGLRRSSSETGVMANTSQLLGQMSGTVPLAIGAGATASGIAALGGPVTSGTAFTFGTAAAGFSMTSVIEGGNAYLDMVDRGIEPSVAAKAAFGVVAPVNGALEIVGMHYFTAPFKNAFSRFAGKAIAGKLASQTGSAAFSQFAREYAKSHLAEVGTEVLQEVVGMSAGGVARQVSTPDAPEMTWSDIFGQLADIGAKTAQGMALIALPGPAFGYVADSIRARQSLLEQEFLKSAAANEGESKLAKRSPNLRLEYLAATARGSDGQTAYIRTADAIEQMQQAGLSIDDLRAKAPDIAERLAVARAAGAEDTAFSTSSYIGKLQNTEFGKVLEPYLRLSENSMPLVELREFAKQDKKLSAEAQQLLDTYRQLGEEWDASAKQVREMAVDSLLAAGKTREEASVLATYLQSFAVTQAHAAQQMPHEWFAAHPLVTQSAAQAAQGQAVEQGDLPRTDTPEFRQWFGESKVVDDNGAPLRVFHGSGTPGFTELRQDGATEDSADAAPEKIARATPTPRPPRGTFDPSRMLITLGKKSDFSTWLHESAHYFLHVFAQVATEPSATEQQRADLDALLRWFKVPGETPEERAAAWSSMPLAEQEKGHETFAYNWEIYLHTGEAPSTELRSIFAQFRVWLMSVYTNIRDTLGAIYRDKFGTELPMLTGEIRQVMGRLLAAEDKISKAEAVRSMVPMFQTEEQSGMSTEEWAAYQAVVADAHAAAVTDLSKASIKQMQWLSGAVDRITRELQRKHKDARDAVELEVAQSVEAEPLYRAMRWLSKGELRGEDGQMVQADRDVNHKLDRAAVLRLFPGRDLASIEGMVVEGGIAPDVAADALGFESGAALVQQLFDAPALEARIEADADELMQQRHGDMNSAEAREAAVEDALHNEARARFVAVELKFLQKSVAPVRQMVAAAREAARRAINELPVRQLTPRTFALAEARAAKKVLQLAGKKDKAVEAIEAKRQQLLMSQMTAEAITARAEVEKAKVAFGRFFKPDDKIAKTRTVDIVAAARSILAWYGFGNADRTPASYVEQLRTYNPTLYAELEPTIARVLHTPTDYRDLTTEEFRGLEASVDALWDSAKRDHLVRVAGKALELEEVTQELQARLGQLNPAAVLPGQTGDVTKRQKMVRGIQNLGAMLKRVEHWAHTMDGAEAGPFTRYVWRPISQAIDAYREQRNKLVKQYVELLQGIDLPVGRIDAHEIGYTFGADNGSVGKATLLGALLHTGNDSNKRKLLLAEERPWATVAEDGELDTTQWDAFVQRMIDEGVLTKRDFAWLQKVWDLLEGTKKQTQDAWHEINGFRMKEVKAQPFTVTFPDGSTETYRGGYVPAKVDADMVRDAAVHAKMDALEGDQRSSFPSTATGFGKTRKEGYLHALSLDVRKIAAHIDQVVRFAHVQPAVRDVMRILRNKQTAGLLGRVDPTAVEELLLPWLNRAAQQQTMDGDPRSLVNRFWSAVRKRTGMGTMFLNLSNAMQQLTGYFPSALRVKPRYLGAAFTSYVRDHKAVTAAAVEASKFMAHRLDNQTFDVADAMNDLLVHPSKWDKIQRWSNRHAYVLQSAFQSQVDVVTWTAAYSQALEDLGPQMSDAEAAAEAVARADAAVRLTQGSLAPEDLAKFEASTAFVKVWTQFSGYFNMLANLNASEYRKLFRDLGWGAFGKKGLARLAGIYVLGFAAPMLISDAIAKTMAGKWDDEDDDGYSDDLAQWFFSSQAKGLAGMAPAFGPAIAAVVKGITSAAQYDDRMSTAPSITALEAATFGVARAVDQVRDGRISGRGVRDVLTLLSLLSGLPVQVLGKPAGYLVDVGTGAAQPNGAVDAVRGLVTGVK